MISICLEHIRAQVSLGVQGNLEAKLPAITQICWDVHVMSLVYPRDVRSTSCCKYSGKMKFNQAKPAMESTGPGPLKLQMADESNCTSPCKESDRDKSSIFRIEVNRIINKFHLSPDSHISHPWIPVKHVRKAPSEASAIHQSRPATVDSVTLNPMPPQVVPSARSPQKVDTGRSPEAKKTNICQKQRYQLDNWFVDVCRGKHPAQIYSTNA